MNSEDLILQHFNILNQRVKSLYNLDLNISFKSDLKGHRLIGQCKKIAKKTYLIRLHSKLLTEFKEVYLDDVLTHELAHAVQMELYPKSKPHSYEWKSILEALSGKRYSRSDKINYNLNRPQRSISFTYRCECMEHQVSSLIHKRIISKIRTYHCRKCKARLIFVE